MSTLIFRSLCMEATLAENKGNTLAVTLRGRGTHSKAIEVVSLGRHLLPPRKEHKSLLQSDYGCVELRLPGFVFVMLKASAWQQEEQGQFQDLIQHLLVKRWTVIMSPGRARDVQITLAGWFHPPAIGYPTRQNADFQPGCLM